MNERIKELAEQAVNAIPDHIDFDIPDVFKEKFAELIVRECLAIAKDVNRNPYLDEHHHARQIIKNITKHFGVKE